MASTYSPNLALELIGTGEQSGTWGVTTDTNLGTLIEQAISGYVTQAITDGADTSITIPNGATGVARNMFIECTGALTGVRNLVVPANKKLYFIYNNTTGGYAVTVKVTGLTGIAVPNGAKMLLVCNGTDVYVAETAINKVIFTAPANSATVTITDGKTLAVQNSLTLAGSDSTTLTFQGTDTYTGRATTDTLTNKRVTARVGSTASSATPTINTDNYDIYKITALAAAITSFTTNLSGTPVDGDCLVIQITDNGTARAITWGAKFEASTVALPTTTVISTLLTVGFIWNTATSAWRCVAAV